MIVVEDDSDIATLLSEILEAEGYAPVAVSDAAGINVHLDPRPDLVVLDLRLTRDGAELSPSSTLAQHLAGGAGRVAKKAAAR